MIRISVQGMKCQKCVARVTELVQAFPQVVSATVDLESATAQIFTTPGTTLPLQQINVALEQAGFSSGAAPTDKTFTPKPISESHSSSADELQSLRFAVGGMSCASCAATIEKKLTTMAGVDHVSVNLAGNFAQITYHPDQLQPQQIYDAVEQSGFKAFPETRMATSQQARKEFLLVLIAAAGALPIMVLMFAPIAHHTEMIASAILATIVQFTAGLGFYRSAWLSLKNRSANMDVLVSLGITAAYGYSVLALFGLLGADAEIFFETSAMLILFIRFGKWLESRAKGQASAALKKLLQLQAEEAVLVVDGKEQVIPTDRIKPGDILLVRAGDTIPVDGEVIEGTAAVDEAMLTGEAVPVHKSVGSTVIGATLNRSGRLLIRATHVGEEAVLKRIIRLVEEAQGDKAPIQRFADRVSGFFVPVVVVLSLVTFIAWYLVASSSFLLAFQMAIAVVVIACPCALGLATPTAIMVGSAVGLERGILFKKASALEQISGIDVMLLDKTGTLTTGIFQVDEVYPCHDLKKADLLSLAAALEQGSTHPLAQAVVARAQADAVTFATKLTDVEEFGGQGLRGSVDGQPVICGNTALMKREGIDTGAIVERDNVETMAGKSLVFVAVNDVLQGVIALSDALRPEAKRVIDHLLKLGIEPVLVTGDRQDVAASVATELGIPRVVAQVLPEGKLQLVQEYQQQQRVAMVGDGINDAPALALADVGIAIGSGTDVARETGDLVLVGGNLFDLVRAVELGRMTLKKIKQNLFWAFFYNLLCIPLAAGVFYVSFGLYLKPEYAGLVMALSSVCVVLNSLSLKRAKFRLQEIGQ